MDNALIPLTQGKEAIVDRGLFDCLHKYNWHAHKHGNTFYAARWQKYTQGKRKLVFIHAEIIGAPPKGYVTDHCDGNGLNNLLSNLRFVTQRQNMQNLHVLKSSKYPGVHYHKSTGKWSANMRLNKKRLYLGVFASEEGAFSAYCNAVKLEGEEVLCKERSGLKSEGVG